MIAKDLRERSLEDLKELEKSLAKDHFQAKFRNFTNRLDDTSTIGKGRRDVARVKTLIAEKNAAEKSKSAAPAAAATAKKSES